MKTLDRAPLEPMESTSTFSSCVELDPGRIERAGLAIPSRRRTIQSEEFRRIKQQLLARIRADDRPDGRPALIGVTSALPGEGKTSTAINLALSLAAEIDISVLLVDADVLRPGLLPRLGLELRPGLLDVLTKPELTLDDVVLHTDIPKLCLLPAGSRRTDAAELLASPAMQDLITAMLTGARNRVVIFDASPLLLATEASALTRLMGQVVMVVEADTTPRKAVLQAFAALEEHDNVYAILNKAPTPPTYGYDDYYG